MNRLFEAGLGLVVLLAFAGFGWLLLANTADSGADTNEYVAIFRKVDGLRAGDDVRIGGVSVGTVKAVEVDPASFEVLATLMIDDQFILTENASAAVLADGLLGGAFVDLRAGFGAAMPTQGQAYIENTNDAVNLTELLSQMIFSTGNS